MTDLAKIDFIGNNTTIHSSVEILIENKKSDGRGIYIGSNCFFYPRNRFILGNMGANPSANMVIGDYVQINAGGYISGEGGLSISDYVLIGPNVCILSAGHKFDDPFSLIQSQGLTYGKIVIKKDAWIGGGSVILEGVTVGEGSIVGAGAVITKDVPDFVVVAGNPAKIIKYRRKPFKKSRIFSLFKRKN